MILMANPNPSHSFTKEDSKKGGKTTTPRKIIANSLRARVYCNSGCRIYPCPYQTLSHAKDARYKGKCALKHAPIKMQERITNLFLGGREGALKELTHVICDLAIKADNAKTLQAKSIYFDKLNKYLETAYGRIIKSETTGEVDHNITVRWKD